MCEHKHKDILKGLTNQNGDNVVLTLCRDCLDIIRYENFKTNKESFKLNINEVYKQYLNLSKERNDITITKLRRYIGIKDSKSKLFIDFINEYKDYFCIDKNKILFMSLKPEEIEGTNLYNKTIQENYKNSFVIHLKVNLDFVNIIISKLNYDLYIINEQNFELVKNLFQKDFSDTYTYLSSLHFPYKYYYKNLVTKHVETINYRKKINIKDLDSYLLEMSKKAKDNGLDLIFNKNEYVFHEYTDYKIK